MLVYTDEWESLQESLFWLSQPGTMDDLVSARESRTAHTTQASTAASAGVNQSSAAPRNYGGTT